MIKTIFQTTSEAGEITAYRIFGAALLGLSGTSTDSKTENRQIPNVQQTNGT